MLIASKVVSDVTVVVRTLELCCVCERGLEARGRAEAVHRAAVTKLLAVDVGRFEACRSRRRGVVCVV